MTLTEAIEELEAMKQEAERRSHTDPGAYGYMMGLIDALDMLADVQQERTNPSIDDALNRGDGSYRP